MTRPPLLYHPAPNENIQFSDLSLENWFTPYKIYVLYICMYIYMKKVCVCVCVKSSFTCRSA